MDDLEIEALLKFCPVCGKELDQHPITLEKACLLHGDFTVKHGVVYFGMLYHGKMVAPNRQAIFRTPPKETS